MNLENEPTGHPEQPPPESVEVAYEQLTAYAFARRYVERKVVADIVVSRGGVAGLGANLLTETAESVTILLSGSSEAVDSGSTAYFAPNVGYREVKLPQLPYAEGHFDIAVAFGVLEESGRPGELLGEIKRILKEGGVLLLSVSDKRIEFNKHEPGGTDIRRGMYVTELRELLKRHFGNVRIYRQGAVAGGVVFPDTEDGTSSKEEATHSQASVEVARFSPDEAHVARFAVEPLTTRSVIAVCCDDAETLGHDKQPYMLLDRQRGVFEERDDLAEDVELMLGEIEQMQQTEVQAFLEAIKAQRQQNLAQLQMRYLFHIRSYLGHRRNITREILLLNWSVILGEIIHRRNIVYGNIHALRKKGIKGSVRGALRRSAGLYRRLAAKDGNPD